ncbi:MAG: hypothetical protein AAFO06_15525 [Cyanobacteria bacterium J06597_16]
MNTTELLATLKGKGIQLWADQDKLRINAPKGSLSAQLKHEIATRKVEILEYLCPPAEALESRCDASKNTRSGLSLRTIGRLIGGGEDAAPVVNSQVMAKQLKITFRPLPKGNSIAGEVSQLRSALEQALESQGVQIVPWENATRKFHYPLPIVGTAISKLLPKEKQPAMDVVRADINAVIDVERPHNRHKSCLAEHLYSAMAKLFGRPTSAAEITQRIGWAEDHAIQRLEDPTATQVVLLTELDERFVNPELPYSEKISLGVNTLISQFSEIVIGISKEKLSILNMNLSDSLFERSQLERFVVRSLIPKLYVPIAPLPLSRFEISHYDPHSSPHAQKLVSLSTALTDTGLFPSGFKLAEVVRRQSHRDIVSAIVNGRTGVSYGFVAYVEPPQYVGAVEISAQAWDVLLPVDGFSFEEVRQTSVGRSYLKTKVGDRTLYKQVPDLWLVCSRSGANKTSLDLSQDILRLGIQGGQLSLQVAEGLEMATADVKPSYDTYVMIAIALAAALYTPELIDQGAPMIHFHGYPTPDWFTGKEDYAGTDNPAVPCGTYESGVFNFLSIHQLAASEQRPLDLIGLVEPDHGINLLSGSLEYLLSRLEQGLDASKIELGGRYLPPLKLDQESKQQNESQSEQSYGKQIAIARGTQA